MLVVLWKPEGVGLRETAPRPSAPEMTLVPECCVR